MDLPPGFRFYPTEEELLSFYLPSKLEGKAPQHKLDHVIPVVDIYEYNPWDLAKHSGECCREDKEQWFFFVPMQEKEGRGGRPNRLTSEGYWKATGSPGHVYSSDGRVIGTKRTMVFYKGRAPKGQKTVWKMNEYNVLMVHGDASSSSSTSCHSTPKLWQELRLCRVYIKSKSVRSFDRRPTLGVQMVDQGGAAPRHVNDTPTTVDHHQEHPPLQQNVYINDSSSPSGDDLVATSNNQDWDDIDQMIVDNNNNEMWDWWAQLNLN